MENLILALRRDVLIQFLFCIETGDVMAGLEIWFDYLLWTGFTILLSLLTHNFRHVHYTLLLSFQQGINNELAFP